MKSRAETTADKLRGGFYTPEPLVDLCLERIHALVGQHSMLRVLEPSVGDGAFLRGLARSSLRDRIADVQGIELIEPEAEKSRATLTALGLPGSVITGSTIAWATNADDAFDVAVGNPPFVRFQFVGELDRNHAQVLAQRLGLSFGGVSNLWLPVLIGALARLRIGGVFAFVVPAECFTGISAAELRDWLVRNVTSLRFDLFAPGSFPDVLQEVVILSGRRREPSPGPVDCTICEHVPNGRTTSTRHSIASGREPWTRYLLTKPQLEAFEQAGALGGVSKLGAIARFEVATVTGANDYFSVDTQTLDAYGLREWSRPLLPRIRHAPGLTYTNDDHAATERAGARVHLLDFSDQRADPEEQARPTEYLMSGTERELHLRYKCRIREPWYRVPSIRPGAMMLSKRSHHFPRVVLNEANVVTTDTIYRGTATNDLVGHEGDLVAAFHNSLTLASAELEGRSFGGGVLELVPSEVSRLRVPRVPGFAAELARLDNISRSSSDGAELVDETDLLLIKADVGLSQDLMDQLRDARLSLLQRRLDRNLKS
jgi:adenine-specific DNA-methyltransferase